MRNDLPYDVLRDFAPVTLVVLNTTLIVVRADIARQNDEGPGRGRKSQAG